MKNIKMLFAAASLSLCGALSADYYADFAAYDAGGSLKWFHSLRMASTDKSESDQIEEKILEVISGKKISDEAFRLACVILKPIATDDSVEPLSKFLGDEKRVVPACDVLQTLDSRSASAALAGALKKSEGACARSILNALASRGDSLDAVIEATSHDDLQVQRLATLALGKYPVSKSVDALEEITKGGDGRVEFAYLALCTLADKAARNSNKALARRALAAVPPDFAMAVVSRGGLSENPQAFYDALVAADGRLARMAGRALSGMRSFEGSQETLENFSKLPVRAKIVVIGSMIPTGDARFWKTVSPELNSSDADLRAEAVYASRFLCEDELDLKKILEISRGSDRSMAALARRAILENPSYVVDKILRDNSKDAWALEMLCLRADPAAERELWSRYLSGGWKKRDVASAVERTVNFGNVERFAENLRTANDPDLKMAVGKIVIKVIAAAKGKGKANEFVKNAFSSAIAKNVSKDDPVYKLAHSKLAID